MSVNTPHLAGPSSPRLDTTNIPTPPLGTANIDSAPVPTAGPSKNALKKAAKAERLAAAKLERRAREKASRKLKRRTIAEKRAVGELGSEEEAEEAARAAKKARVGGPKQPFRARVVIDVAFDEKMTEKEVASLVSQLGYTYAANRQSPTPFSHILVTGLGGRAKQKMDGMSDAGYRRWANCEFWEESYEDLWRSEEGASTDGAAHVGKERARALKESVVYLTADSDFELTELKEDETYIIGGIVDRNRYKSLCLDKATASGVRHARLPIGRYLAQMQTRKVLTVNQVFEILVRWAETRDWADALTSIMPKRKLAPQNAPGASSQEGEATVVVVAEDEAEAEARSGVDADDDGDAEGGTAARFDALTDGTGVVNLAVDPPPGGKAGLSDDIPDPEDVASPDEQEAGKNPALQLPSAEVVVDSIAIDQRMT